MQLSIMFLRTVEHVASDKFQFEAWQRTGSGEYTARVLTLWKGLLERCVGDVMRRMHIGSTWQAVPPVMWVAGLASRALSIVYTTRCAIEQLALVSLRCFPFALWQLIEDRSIATAQVLLNEPQCTWCEFTKQFFARFNTAARLCSDEARALLVAMAIFVRVEITRIECRHAQLRKMVMASATWKPLLEEISAKFVMLRSRVLQAMFDPSGGNVRDSVLPRKCKIRKTGKTKWDQKAGGGGGQRASVGRFLRGKKYKTKEEKKAVFAEANRRYGLLRQRPNDPEHEEVMRAGAAGTVSRRAGALSFKGWRKKPAAKKRLDVRNVVTSNAGSGAVQQGNLVAVDNVARTRLDDFDDVLKPSEQLRQEQQRARANVAAAAEWSKNNLHLCGDPIWAKSAGQPGLHQVQQSPPDDGTDFSMNVFHLTPPAREIAGTVLRACHRHYFEKGLVQEDLLNQWTEIHGLITDSDHGERKRLPHGKSSLNSVSLCRRVGLCICGAAMAPRRDFRRALGGTLRKFFLKRAPGRSIYDRGMAVLRFRFSRPRSVVENVFFSLAMETSMIPTSLSSSCCLRFRRGLLMVSSYSMLTRMHGAPTWTLLARQPWSRSCLGVMWTFGSWTWIARTRSRNLCLWLRHGPWILQSQRKCGLHHRLALRLQSLNGCGL